MKYLLIIISLFFVSCSSTPSLTDEVSLEVSSLSLKSTLKEVAKSCNLALDWDAYESSELCVLKARQTSLQKLISTIEEQTSLELTIKNNCLIARDCITTFQLNENMWKDLKSFDSTLQVDEKMAQRFFGPLFSEYGAAVLKLTNDRKITVRHRRQDKEYIEQTLLYLNYLEQKREIQVFLKLLRADDNRVFYTFPEYEGEPFDDEQIEILDKWQGKVGDDAYLNMEGEELYVFSFNRDKELRDLTGFNISIDCSVDEFRLFQVLNVGKYTKRTLHIRDGIHLQVYFEWRLNGEKPAYRDSRELLRSLKSEPVDINKALYEKFKQVISNFKAKDMTFPAFIYYLEKECGILAKVPGYNTDLYFELFESLEGIPNDEDDPLADLYENIKGNYQFWDNRKITIDADNIPLGELVKYVTEMIGLQYSIEAGTLYFLNRGSDYSKTAVDWILLPYKLASDEIFLKEGAVMLDIGRSLFHYFPSSNSIMNTRKTYYPRRLYEIARMLGREKYKMVLWELILSQKEMSLLSKKEVTDKLLLKRKHSKIEILNQHELIKNYAELHKDNFYFDVQKESGGALVSFKIKDKKFKRIIGFLKDEILHSEKQEDGSFKVWFLKWIQPL